MCWTPLSANKHKEGKQDTSPPTNNWRKRQTEHRFYAEIVTEHRTQNAKTHNRTTRKTKKMSKMYPTKKPGVILGAGEV
jgi:hypothetical protein